MTEQTPRAGDTPLHVDLDALLDAVRSAERDLFDALDPDARDAPHTIGEWSAKDVQGHLAAWRGIEARRMTGTTTEADPDRTEEDDVANARLHAERSDWSWEEVRAEAVASLDALGTAIGHSEEDLLCQCDNEVAGQGVNGVNHAMAHLSDVARLAGAEARYDAFAREVEEILVGNHLPPRDAGVVLYNIACHYALTDRADDARRTLRGAFVWRPDLVTYAAEDPDLISLRDELADLSPTG